MNFDSAAARAASIVLAAAACLAGCGGGGSGDQASTSTASEAPATSGTTQDSVSASDPSTTTSAADKAAAVASAATDATTTPDVSAGASTTTSGTSPTTTTDTSTSDSTAPVQVASASTPAAPQATAQAARAVRSGMGVNLAGLVDYTAEVPTIDFMKKAGAWFTQCTDQVTCKNFTAPASGYDTQEESKLDLDADGWIRSLPAASDTTVKYRMVTTNLTEAGVQQPGTYTVVYDGKGTITYLGAASKVASQSTAGRDVVTVTNTTTTPFYLRITATDPTNYIRNIRVYPPGGACQNDLTTYVASAASCTGATGKFVAFENFPAGTTWHPAMIASLKGFRSIRFMDWSKTNATAAANWTDRTPATARTWTGDAGAPLEAMFDLAAKVGADPWMNIPPHATDAYVHSFGQLAHAHLAPGAKLYLEYGNEMWNFSFPATKWGVTQSQAAFPKQLAAGANPVLVYLNWYALRLGQVCQMVKSEFGADASRVQCVANTQAASSGNTENVLQCVYAQSLLGQPCAKIFDAVAIAPYFGYYIGGGATAATVSGWTANADGGLGAMFQEILGTNTSGASVIAPLFSLGAKSSSGSVAEINAWMTSNKAVATKYGLPLLAYEGGQGLIPTSDTKVMNLMFAANRDARMGTAYQQMLTNWKNAGGQTFMLFSDVGIYSHSGMWGMRESMYDQSNPKWQAAVSWRDKVVCWWSGC